MSEKALKNRMNAFKDQKRQMTQMIRVLTTLRPELDKMEIAIVTMAKILGYNTQDITKRQQVDVMILGTTKDLTKTTPTQDCYEVWVDIFFPLAKDHQAFQGIIPMWRNKGEEKPFTEEEVIKALAFRGMQMYKE